MMRRMKDLEHWRKDTERVLLELVKEITIIERKLNRLCPLGSEVDAMSERATTGSGQSICAVAQENASPNASSSPVSPQSLPSSFTKRKGDGIERMALDTNGLRLSQAESSARKWKSAGASKR